MTTVPPFSSMRMVFSGSLISAICLSFHMFAPALGTGDPNAKAGLLTHGR